MHKMLILPNRRGDSRIRFRGTGFSQEPGGVTWLAHQNRWSWSWEWPTGKMSWFLWRWQPRVFSDTTFWRLGPLNVTRRDF